MFIRCFDITVMNPGGSVATLSPGLVKTWDALSLGGQPNFVRSFHWIAGAQGFAQYALASRVSIRITLAGGQTIDGPGIEDRFKSLAIDVKWQIDPRWGLIPNFGYYKGQTRTEKSFGLRLEAGR